MAQLIDIRKVAIGPRFLTARICLDAAAPLFTDEDPEGTARVLDLLPDIAGHACLGDAGPLFGDAVESTEVAHLFEHVTIELMARTGLAGDITSGRTKACVDEDRAYEVRVLCPDDVLAVGALSSAAFVLDWAYTGGGDPRPAVDSITEGLVSIVESANLADAEPVGSPMPEEAVQHDAPSLRAPESQQATLASEGVAVVPNEAELVFPEDEQGFEEEALPAQDDGPEGLEVEPPAPRRSTIVMVAGPGVEPYVEERPEEPMAEPEAQGRAVPEAVPQPIMVAGPGRSR